MTFEFDLYDKNNVIPWAAVKLAQDGGWEVGLIICDRPGMRSFEQTHGRYMTPPEAALSATFWRGLQVALKWTDEQRHGYALEFASILLQEQSTKDFWTKILPPESKE